MKMKKSGENHEKMSDGNPTALDYPVQRSSIVPLR